MTKGISIHLGLNSIDPQHYNGNSGKLKNPENDAKAMRLIANSLGYQSTMLLTKDATSSRFLSELYHASQNLEYGDTLLLTYAGHGSRIIDINSDEEDGYDETWVLYDRMLIDDELYNSWSKFKEGVRIILISDSCHSGTVSRVVNFLGNLTTIYPIDEQFRCLPVEVSSEVFQANKPLYESIKFAVPREVKNDVTASVLLISGCQDTQLSSDGVGNGAFTASLLRVWNNGSYSGNYKSFHNQIKLQMPATQVPNYYLAGKENNEFENGKPFVLNSTSRQSKPDIDEKNINTRKINWEIGIDEDKILKMNDFEIGEYIKNDICNDMVNSYKNYKKIRDESSNSRSSRGFGCEIKVSSEGKAEIKCGGTF